VFITHASVKEYSLRGVNWDFISSNKEGADLKRSEGCLTVHLPHEII